MRIKISRNVKQDRDGYWWIVNSKGKMVRKVADHAIIQNKDKLWYVKKRNGELSEKGFATLQEAFDYDDDTSRLKAFAIFILIAVVLALVFSFVQ